MLGVGVGVGVSKQGRLMDVSFTIGADQKQEKTEEKRLNGGIQQMLATEAYSFINFLWSPESALFFNPLSEKDARLLAKKKKKRKEKKRKERKITKKKEAKKKTCKMKSEGDKSPVHNGLR